jgi:DNA repair ATPase RecN
MMAPGFTIAEVRFRGANVPDAAVTFAPGLSVVAGPSNTGKSLIRAAINFVFGSRDPMTTVDEAAGYDVIFVQVRTAEGNPITFERSWGRRGHQTIQRCSYCRLPDDTGDRTQRQALR